MKNKTNLPGFTDEAWESNYIIKRQKQPDIAISKIIPQMTRFQRKKSSFNTHVVIDASSCHEEWVVCGSPLPGYPPPLCLELVCDGDSNPPIIGV
jgi:hypothetical protein